MKTSELTGALLDYWVARAEGWRLDAGAWHVTLDETASSGIYAEVCMQGAWLPSTSWTQGGPILERMRLLEITACIGGEGWYVRGPWRPCDGDQFYGETLLVAAMRAYVASKFGDEVQDMKGVA